MRFAPILLAGAILAPGLAVAQQVRPEAAVVAATAERTAIVETVNMTERSVLLRGDSGAQSGALATVRVGPEVRNLGQVRPGDRVVVTVTDAIAASLARPGDGAAPTGSAAFAARAPEGARPAAGVGDAVRTRVRIEGIDLGRNSVTFTTPENERRTVRVQNPRMRQFIRTLSPGDMVDVVFVETVSLRVLPPG